MMAIPAEGDIGLEEMAAILKETEPDRESHREYIREKAGQIRQEMAAEEAVVKELLGFEQPVTADNLMSAGLFMKERGRAAGRLYDLAEETGEKEKLEAAMEDVYESMAGEAPMKAAYERLGQAYEEILEKAVYGQEETGKIDIREISSLYKQVSFAGNMAQEENYEVPVRIGEEMTSINLKIIHGRKESGKVMLSMETVAYGRAAAQFGISIHGTGEYHLSGYVACERKESMKMLENIAEGLKKSLEQADIKIVSLNFVHNEGLDLAAVSGAAVQAREEIAGEDGKQQIPTKKLYDAAKIFIGYIRKGEGIDYENML